MGKRTPVLSRRIQGLVNWPSNVRHNFLSKYIEHVFQNHIIATPGIRASTSAIWVNITVFSHHFHPLHGSNAKSRFVEQTVQRVKVIEAVTEDQSVEQPLVKKEGVMEDVVVKTEVSTRISDHPLVKDCLLRFQNVKLENALGTMDVRIKALMDGSSEKRKAANLSEGHFYFKPLSEGAASSLIEASESPTLETLQIYSDKPIHLRINIIENPLQDAQVLAHYVARSLKENDRSLPKIFKQLLTSINGKM